MSQKRKISYLHGSLLVLSFLGWLVSLWIHFQSIQSVNVQERYPWVWLLHFGAILLLVAFVLFTTKENRKRTLDFKAALIKPIWPLLLLLVMGGYALWNFTTHAGSFGNFTVKKGEYLRTSRGRVLERFPNKESFLRAKRAQSVREIRSFSGHWLFFYGAIFLFLLALQFQQEKSAGEGAFGPGDQAALGEGDPLEDGVSRLLEELHHGGVSLPDHEHLSFRQRLFRHTGWRLLLVMIGLQVLVLGAIALIFKHVLAGFAALFISLNFLNYFFYRNQIKDQLRRVQSEKDGCRIEVYRYDKVESLHIPWAALRVAVEEEASRGKPSYYMRFFDNGVRVLQQKCDVGFWTEWRCRALSEELAIQD